MSERNSRPVSTARLVGLGCLVAVFILAGLEFVAEVAVVAYWKVKGGPEEDVRGPTDALFFLGQSEETSPRDDRLAPSVRYIGAISSRYFRLAQNAAGERWREWEPVDPVLGWRYAPGAAVTQFIPAGPVLARYVTTPQGFISPDWTGPVYAIPKPPGVFRVIVLGGSTVAGGGAESPADTLPARLAPVLAAAAGGRRPVEVINAGVSGYDAARELLYLLTELVAYQPDLVVVYDGGNELFLNDRLVATGDERQVFRPIADSADRLEASYSVSGSAGLLMRAVGAWVNFHVANGKSGLVAAADILRQLVAAGTGQPSAAPPTARVHGNISLIYRNVHNTMVALSKIHGFRIAVFLQPLLGEGEKPLTEAERDILQKMPAHRVETRHILFRAFGAQIKDMQDEHAGEKGVCLGDLRNTFADVSERMYVDGGHLNGAGSRVVANEIATRLNACHLLDDLAATSR